MIADVPPRLLRLVLDGGEEPSARAVSTPRGAGTFRDLVAAGRSRGLSTDSIADAMDRRIRRYIDRVGSVQKGNRDNAAFGVACWLLRDFALSETVAWEYLREWNARNAPPLHERELRDKMRSAQRSGRHPVGCAHVSRGSAA